jgi:hypothetical protein
LAATTCPGASWRAAPTLPSRVTTTTRRAVPGARPPAAASAGRLAPRRSGSPSFRHATSRRGLPGPAAR